MLKLGKKAQYALVALFHLDRIEPGSRASTHDLSERYDIPEPHLGKVLQRMSRAGILKAVKGVRGGYELERPLEDLRLGDLMSALEPEGRRPRPQSHTVLSVFPSCYVQGLAREVERRAIRHLHDMALTDLLEHLDPPDACLPTLEMSS